MDLDLNSLLTLAAEPSSEKRRELLRRVTDLFLNDSARHDAETQALFGGVMEKISGQVDSASRKELSARLAPSEQTPNSLAVKLASDEDIEVAAPMLSQSPVLTNSDLVEIGNKAGQEHLLAMTEREYIASQVTDVLIRRGSQAVLRGVSNNPRASLSHEGAGRLAERAHADAELATSLLARADLPEQYRQRVCESPSLRNAAGQASHGNQDTHVAGGMVDEFVSMSGLAKDRAWQMLKEGNLGLVIIMARAIEMPVDQFRRLVISRFAGPETSESEIARTVSKFSLFPVSTAKRIARFMKVRTVADTDTAA